MSPPAAPTPHRPSSGATISAKAGIIIDFGSPRSTARTTTTHRKTSLSAFSSSDDLARFEGSIEQQQKVQTFPITARPGRPQEDRGVVGRIEAGGEASQAVGERRRRSTRSPRRPAPGPAGPATRVGASFAPPPHYRGSGAADAGASRPSMIIVGLPRPPDRATSRPGRPGAIDR